MEDSPKMASEPDLSGVSIVGAGNFNPAIFQPHWLEAKHLISPTAAASAAEELVITPDLTAFRADWLSVQVGLQQMVFSTVDEGRDLDLRDVVAGVWGLLPETPMDAIGINADAHYRLESEEVWHALGDRLAPKDVWEPVFNTELPAWKRRPDGHFVGLRTMTVESHRDDDAGYVRVEVGPSVRVKHGVYVGVNSHFQLTQSSESRGNAVEASSILATHWQETRQLEHALIASLMAQA